ncbi:unnamed protein product [Closterium sp. NIES-64]|nr:unnamed protein product [Closterium sp. NIES-64]
MAVFRQKISCHLASLAVEVAADEVAADEVAAGLETVHPLVVRELLEAELDEHGVEVLLPQAWSLLDAVQRLLEEANGVAFFLEGVRLLDVNDGVDDCIEEGVGDIDFTQGALLHSGDIEENQHRSVAADSATSLECSNFCGHGGSPLLSIGPVEGLANGGGFDQLLVTLNADGESKYAKTCEVGFLRW